MDALLAQRLTTREREALQEAGALAARLKVRLFLAGGSVRDVILDRPHQDWDLVVEGDGPEFARQLAARNGGRAILHDRFLTAEVRLGDGSCMDVATARRETYPQPGALPEVSPACIEEDLWRRDFSINAVAVALNPPEWGQVIDPTGGIRDMEAGVVRALHRDSFWDDATRIVRAIGFEQRLGFVMEPATEKWLRRAATHGALQTVSTERLGETILPLLGNSVGASVLKRAGALGVPAALGARGAFTRRTLRALDDLHSGLEALGEAHRRQSRVVGCLATLLLSRGVDAEEIILRLHLDRFTAREVRSAGRFLSLWPRGFRPASLPGDLWEQLREASFGGIMVLWLAARSPQPREALQRYWRDIAHLRADITAVDFEALGYRPGPAFGDALDRALREKLNHGAGPREQLAAAQAVLDHAHTTQS